MIIENPAVGYLGTRFVTLSFPVSQHYWDQIVSNGYLNFNPDLFEDSLPTPPYTLIELEIIGTDKGIKQQIDSNNELTLNYSEWNILNCTIDGKKYPTFFSSLDWEHLPDSFTENIVSFISRKTAGSYAGELIPAEAMESLLKKMILGLENAAVSGPSSLAEISVALMKGLVSNSAGTTLSVREQVEEYLRAENIPVDFEESSFYFQVTRDKISWSVEICLAEEDGVLTVYSSTPLEPGKEGLTGLLRNINELNRTINYGNYEYSPSLDRLYFKTALPVIGNRIGYELITETMGHNLQNMAGIMAVLDKIAP